jgi:hypothetical protein
MSIPVLAINKVDYEARKQFLEDLKFLSKEEYEELFRIIKRNNIDYSENSNGVFFDLTSISNDIFSKLVTFLDFCKVQKKSEEVRAQEMDTLRSETVEHT